METCPRVVKGQFSPQVLVLAACLPYFSSLIAGKTSATSGSNGQGGVVSKGETPTAQTATGLFECSSSSFTTCLETNSSAAYVSEIDATTDDSVRLGCREGGHSPGSLFSVQKSNHTAVQCLTKKHKALGFYH